MTQHDIDCEQALKHLFDFIDRELDDSERDAMQRHLQTCRSCYSRASFERRLKEQLHDLRREEPAADVNERIRRLLQSF